MVSFFFYSKTTLLNVKYKKIEFIQFLRDFLLM